MNASSELARTSLAAAPIAAPKAAKPAPPATIAGIRAGTAPSRSTTRAERRPASAASRRATTTTPSRTFSASRADVRDEPAGEPGEGVLLALERQRARDQQDGHEHQRDRRGDRDRERVEARGIAVDDLLVDLDRLRRPRSSRSPAEPRFSAREVGELDHPVELVDIGLSAGSWALTWRRICSEFCSPRMRDAVAEEAEVAAVEQDLQVLGRDVGDLAGRSSGSPPMSSELIRSSTRPALIGSSWLTSTSTSGCSGFSPASDCSLSSRSAGRISAAEHVAGLDLLARLRLAGDGHALDPLAELARGAEQVEVARRRSAAGCRAGPR